MSSMIPCQVDTLPASSRTSRLGPAPTRPGRRRDQPVLLAPWLARLVVEVVCGQLRLFAVVRVEQLKFPDVGLIQPLLAGIAE